VTFEEFLASELDALRRYAAVLTGEPQQAHDVLADTLLRAHTLWHRIGRMDRPGAYVRRMVTSTFLSEKRRWSVRYITATRSGELPDVALPDSTTAVDDRMALHSLLAGLPPRQRATIVLRYYLGLDNADIAMELGITVGAARTAVSRGLAALKISAAETSEYDDVLGRTPTGDGAPGRPRIAKES
jgi:RNA polymerase sigma-70 factor (sigma-E family)